MKDHELSLAQYKLAESLNKARTEIEFLAVKAIQAYAKAEKVIPEELLPYLDRLCDEKTKGNYNTKMNRNKLIAAVEKLRSERVTRDKAIEEVAKQYNVEESSLKTRYKEGDARELKDAVELEVSMGKWGVQK